MEERKEGVRMDRGTELVACSAKETGDCKCMSGGQVRSVTAAAGWATPVSMTN